MSRKVGLARTLRGLKEELADLLERKSSYDHDANRAVAALGRFAKIVEREERLKSGTPEQPPSGRPAQKQPLSPEEEPKQEPDAPPPPTWAKKAFRLIAFRTHPDKINVDDTLTDTQRDRLVSLYHEATRSYQEGDWESLAEVAAELEVEIEIPDADLEKALESKVKSVRSEIANMQKTLSWHWGISFGDMQKRVLVLKGCCKVMKIPTPEDSVLEDIIKELESQPDFDIVDRLGRVRRIKSGADRRKLGTRPVKRIR